jgi:hypothetical protein
MMGETTEENCQKSYCPKAFKGGRNRTSTIDSRFIVIHAKEEKPEWNQGCVFGWGGEQKERRKCRVKHCGLEPVWRE